MSVAARINRPATILRRSDSGGEDEFGNPVKTTAEVVVVCELQQRRRDEGDDLAETSDTLWDLFLPAGTEIDTGDAIVVDGEEYEMVGEPWEARNPRTRTFSHIQATVRRTAGAGD